MKNENYELANIRAMRTMLARDGGKNARGGRHTKVKAKNLMICDAFLLIGGKTGYVVDVYTTYNDDSSEMVTTIRIMNHHGKLFTRQIPADNYVHISEFPWSRRARRALSRVPLKYRYTFGKRKS